MTKHGGQILAALGGQQCCRRCGKSYSAIRASGQGLTYYCDTTVPGAAVGEFIVCDDCPSYKRPPRGLSLVHWSHEEMAYNLIELWFEAWLEGRYEA